jgi:hypothetical protein
MNNDIKTRGNDFEVVNIPEEIHGDNALEALDRLSSTWYTGDMAEDWSHEGDIQTIRTALTQSAEKDTVICDLAKQLKGVKGCIDSPQSKGFNRLFPALSSCVNQTLKTHAEAIKRAEEN